MQAWLEALTRLQAKEPDGVTLREFAEETGMGESRARAVFRQLIAGKLAVCNGLRKVLAIDGTLRPVPVYKLLPKRK